jgi:hypothetical protein
MRNRTHRADAVIDAGLAVIIWVVVVTLLEQRLIVAGGPPGRETLEIRLAAVVVIALAAAQAGRGLLAASGAGSPAAVSEVYAVLMEHLHESARRWVAFSLDGSPATAELTRRGLPRRSARQPGLVTHLRCGLVTWISASHGRPAAVVQ